LEQFLCWLAFEEPGKEAWKEPPVSTQRVAPVFPIVVQIDLKQPIPIEVLDSDPLS
jgi:hypothetical protein